MLELKADFNLVYWRLLSFTQSPEPMKFVVGVLWFLLLLVRGIALWAVVPLSVVAWLLVHSWAQKATIRQSICWYDLNLLVFLIHVPFCMLMRLDPQSAGARFVGISWMSKVEPRTHGGSFDLFWPDAT